MMRMYEVSESFYLGMWGVLVEYPILRCSDCGKIVKFDVEGNLIHEGTDLHVSEVNYCPHCGSKAENQFNWEDKGLVPIIKAEHGWKINKDPKGRIRKYLKFLDE